MKKLLFTLAVVVAATSLMAQKKVDQEMGMNVIKVNPLGLLFGSAGIGYERALNEKSAIQINGTFGGLSVGGVKYTNFGGGVDYRAYFSKDKSAPKGFYASPGVGFYSVKVKESGGTSFTGSGFIAKGVIGNQWIFGSGFVIDLNGGIQYYAGGKIKGSGGVEYTKFDGILPALTFAIGYNF